MVPGDTDLEVTIGLVSGGRLHGQIGAFAPDWPTLVLYREGEGAASAMTLPSESIAYVAFRHAPETFPSALAAGFSKRCRIHVGGGDVFLVRTGEPDGEAPPGFFAVPVDPDPALACLYFYDSGVNAREEDSPIGSMLVRDGAVDTRDIERGLEVQSNGRPTVGEILVARQEIDTAALDHGVDSRARKNVRIGEVLVSAGLITREALEMALAEQRRRGGRRLGDILVEMGLLSERKLASVLAEKFFIRFVDLEQYPIQQEAIEEVGRELIEKHRILPIASDRAHLTVAISDPLAMDAIDALRFRIKKHIQEVLVTRSQLEEFIGLHVENHVEQSKNHDVERILKEFADNDLYLVDPPEDDELDPNASDNAVVKLANQIIADAIRRGASDIHIEPNGRDRDTVVRFRVDGECHVYQQIPPILRKSLVARVKVISRMDIAERRKPQDGKTRFRLGDESIELRVVTLPTGEGEEDVVLRILANVRPPTLGEMNLAARNQNALVEVLARPHGLILCVGPTGSGKTTTLHSMLGHINTVDTKIWTAEDPIEITQPGLRQLQIRPKIGLTFAAALRSFLRADPDVIMVGEMRDHETAAMAIEASLTGHLVLSTLHTNSAAETVTRLIEIGLEPFSFADALLAVLAQRLVRALCAGCREQYEPSEEEQHRLALELGQEALDRRVAEEGKALVLWRASGCAACGGSGYKGRIAVHELLVANAPIRRAIERRQSAPEIHGLAMEGGLTTLVQDGLQKALGGVTDLKQVLAVCRQ